VEGLEGSLNLPVGETVNWSNNLTWMLQSKNKTTGDRLSVIPQFTLNSTSAGRFAKISRCRAPLPGMAGRNQNASIIRARRYPAAS
jgi:hypothetical protein